MTPERCELIGGPLDGLWTSQRIGVFAYFAPYGTNTRAHADPGGGRHLYRRRGYVYLYAGHLWRRCDGCGAFVQHPGCEICLHH